MPRNRPINRRRILRFEQFESRRLMAVTASLDHHSGTLTITGDAGMDEIDIVGTANAGELVITGRDGAEVNGVPNGSVIMTGVTADLLISLGDGDNILNVNNVYVAGNINLTTGSGADRVTLGEANPVSPAGRLDIRTGAGSDLVRALNYNVYIGGFSPIDLGDGETDIAVLQGASSVGSISVFNSGSTGYVQISITGLTTGGTLGAFSHGRAGSISVITSAASLTMQVGGRTGVNRIYIDTCYAAEYIYVHAFNHEAPLFLLNQNGSIVTVARCQASQLIVRTGGNLGGTFGTIHEPNLNLRDSVTLYGNLVIGPPYNLESPGFVVHAIYVETGKADDRVELSYNVTYERLFVYLGDDQDQLILTANQIAQNATLDGALGTDSVSEAWNAYGSQTVLNFP